MTTTAPDASDLGAPVPAGLPGPVGAHGSTSPAPVPAARRARLPLRRPVRRGYPWPAPTGIAAHNPGQHAAGGAQQTVPDRPERILAGVCAGLAAHLDLPVARVRLGMVLLSLLGGANVLFYALLWLFVPAGDPWDEVAGAVLPARARIAQRLGETAPRPHTLTPRVRTLLGGGALLLAAGLVAAWRAGLVTGRGWLLPALVVMAGAALAWSQIDAVTGPEHDRGARLRLAGGVVLSAVGILLWIGSDVPLRVLVTGALTGGALVVVLGLVLAPLWLRTNRALAETRAAEAREAERADIAAHLHDSVLQTLTLIRKRADEPDTVARLARSQERELRAWLYTDRPEAGTSVGDAVADLVAEIEDRHGVPIDLVVVGDRPPDRATEVVVAAAREALSNAVRHGAPPVSVYAEITADRLEVFVRDRGAGFDPQAVAPDRHGVRESIIARMERHGGSARVRRLERGTEIHLALPR